MKMTVPVKRVLIYRLGSLGDTLVALPALKLVARAFPSAERRMLTNFPVMGKAPAAAAVLGHTGLVDSYERYGVGERNPLRLLGLAWRIRRWKPEVLVYLAGARGVEAGKRDAVFFRLCGIRRIVGLPLTEDLQTHLPRENGLFEREGERLARCLDEIGDAEVQWSESWRLPLTEKERERAAKVLEPLGGRRFFSLSLGTKAQANEWGDENWRDLLAELVAAYPESALVLLGSEEDRSRSEAVAAYWPGGAINVCGQLTPRESAAVLAEARVFLGHDSGPMHLAASVGAPIVGVFSSRNLPGVWFPYGERSRIVSHAVSCGGCGLVECVVEKKRCIVSIEVAEVMAAVREVVALESTLMVVK